MSGAFINELYDHLERDPVNVALRELILELWVETGDQDMAHGTARDLLELDPLNAKAQRFLQSWQARSPHATAGGSSQEASVSRRMAIRPGPRPQTTGERIALEDSLEERYAKLRQRAQMLEKEVAALETVGATVNEKAREDLRGIIDGRISSMVSRTSPKPVRELVRELSGTREMCQALVIEDFDEVMRWIVAENPEVGADLIRKRLLQRREILEAALPKSLQGIAITAMMHIEHELADLGKTYANTETMLGDPVSEIPRANFLVTEDNYAWDMEELASALTANNGVMRNPLSREMFSQDDVRKILAHPLGQRLRPLNVEQSQLKKGVRSATIDHLAELGQTMLQDQSADAAPSMQAVDEFLVYTATLPADEQRTLDVLKVPARDSHTGQPYDYTIGESIRDAKANRTCFHKTGDFLGQAARFLRAA